MKKFNIIYISILVFALGIAAHGQAAGSACGDTDYACKIASYTRSIAADPKDIESYYNRALAYQHNGQYDSALMDFDKYISLKPSKPAYLADGYVGRGDVYRETEKFDLAIADYSAALLLDPGNHRGRLNRGIAYWRKFDYANALKDYNALILANAKDPEAYYNRALVYMDQKRNVLAIADLDKYVALDVTNNEYLADGFLNRGIVRFRNADLQGSLADFAKSIALNPNNPKVYSARAETYRKLRKTDLANADDQKAAELGNQ